MTPRVLQHKRRRIALKKQRTQKNKEEASEYAKLLAKRMKVMCNQELQITSTVQLTVLCFQINESNVPFYIILKVINSFFLVIRTERYYGGYLPVERTSSRDKTPVTQTAV